MKMDLFKTFKANTCLSAKKEMPIRSMPNLQMPKPICLTFWLEVKFVSEEQIIP